MSTELLSIIIQSISFGLYCSIGIYTILYPNEKKIHFLIYSLLLGAGELLAFLISPLMMLPFFLALIGYIYYSHVKSLFSLISIPITYMIVVLSTNLFTAVFQSVFHTDYATISISIPILILLESLICVATFGILYLGKKLLHRTLFHTTRSLPSGTITMICTHTMIYSAIILMIVLISPALMISTSAMIIMCVVTLCFLILTLVINYHVLKKSENTILAQEQLKQFENLKEYAENLEQVYNNIRSFKHDYVNIMTSISSYLDEKRYDELTEYFYTDILPTKEALNHNTDTLNRLMHVKQLEVKSLLSYKMLYAVEQGIQIHIDIPDDIEAINMKSVDLLRILGIYLDNAIEAALETERPQVNLHMANMESYIAILIENSYVDHGIPISKMLQKDVTSKGEGHGVGLHNANEILLQYPNILHETYTEHSMFYQHLQIADK